jgi:uncharacterized protein YihD (DUF1040 family)
MRDPKRIPEVLEAVRKVWEKDPDQRLGQLLLNAARNDDGMTDKHKLWNMEAAELVRRLGDM